MGNYVSCSLSSPLTKNSSTKVILPNGEVRQIQEPTKAAELMLEIPNHFLADAKSLKIGRKFSPLTADEDLGLGSCHVYAMFPMTRAGSAANASDMARLFRGPKKLSSRGSFRWKITPEYTGGECCGEGDDVRLMLAAVPKLKLDDVDTELIMHRISVSKSKKPLLETIQEQAVFSR